MSDTSTNGNNITQTSGQIKTSTVASPPITTASMQQSSHRPRKPAKTPATPSDGLAVAGLFFAVGVFASYFPVYSHTPQIQGLCQCIAYICYGIGFLGGCFELSKLTSSQFFETFGIGAIMALISYGVNVLADLTGSIYPILSLSLCGFFLWCL